MHIVAENTWKSEISYLIWILLIQARKPEAHSELLMAESTLAYKEGYVALNIQCDTAAEWRNI